MELPLLFLALLLLFPCPLLAHIDPPFNHSSVPWATSLTSEELDDVEPPGFSSLDGMLQWAIGHSDPETLKGAAQTVQYLTPTELAKRQSEIKELMESLRMPSDADLMKTAITDLENSSLTMEYRQRALQELLELVEPIDNANDLSKMGGLTVLIKELDRPEEELRIFAAWVLGKASQNNGIVQNQLLELGVLPRLMQMVRSNCAEEAVKALYAVSALVRNHLPGQEAFYHHGGALLLEDLMKNASSDIRLRRKSLFLIADLAEQGRENGGTYANYQPSTSFLLSVVNTLAAPDLDTQEKMQALMAIYSLGQSSSVTHKILRDDCEVRAVVEKFELQLDDLMNVEDQVDFAKDMQALCQMVKSMFFEDHEARTSSI